MSESINMKEYDEQKEKAGEYGVISGERWVIYIWPPHTHQASS
jgi:hypothetical protein